MGRLETEKLLVPGFLLEKQLPVEFRDFCINYWRLVVRVLGRNY